MCECVKPCPFCNSSFRRLGSHLSKCRMRQGRDYSMYLSQRTLDNRRSRDKPKKAKCPKCQKLFIRLETHLRKNPFCKEISSQAPEPDSSTPDQPTTIQQSSSPDHQADPNTPAVEARLLLPTSDEDWFIANACFRDQVTPRVIQATSVDDKNTNLVEGLYSYFAEKYGTRKPTHTKKMSTQHKQDRALKKVRNLKNQARRAYRQAKRNRTEQVDIQSLVRNFFKLVQSHSSLKKLSTRGENKLNAKRARQSCFKDFWKFTSNLLDDKPNNNWTSPTFTEEKAYDFFQSTYQSPQHTYERPSWMPAPKLPTQELENGPIEEWEVTSVTKRSRHSSAPSPSIRYHTPSLRSATP